MSDNYSLELYNLSKAVVMSELQTMYMHFLIASTQILNVITDKCDNNQMIYDSFSVFFHPRLHENQNPRTLIAKGHVGHFKNHFP